jgi:uncharacterized protein YbjT (DUF2867 family)
VGLKIRATFQSPAVAAKAPAGLEGVIMDYAKPETIRAALHRVEKIFLVGPPVRDLPALEANFVKEVRAAGRKHIVKTFSSRRAGVDVPERASRFGREH